MKKLFKKHKKEKLTDVYTIVKEIGRGGTSIVYRGAHLKTGEPVAVKTILKHAMNAAALQKIEREVNIMKSLSHPNIIRLIDYFESDTEIHLVLDLVEGGELFDHIVERGSYCEHDAAIIVRQILEAVAYMHSNGIAHRDLKPENLLCPLGHDLIVKIADFGLSNMFNKTGEKSLVTACGTPDYVAPEILSSKPYTELVDVWSIGVITYTLLCGYTPFYGTVSTDLFAKIRNVEYDFPPQEWSIISHDAIDFIQTLLVANPDQRPTAEECLEHKWIVRHTGDAPPSREKEPSLAHAQQRLRLRAKAITAMPEEMKMTKAQKRRSK